MELVNYLLMNEVRNEMRLIEADALKEDFKHRLEKAKNWKENALTKGDEELVIRATATIDFICEVIMTINNAPTVEEIPQGEWIEVDDIEIDGYCSNCGWESKLYEEDILGMPFCPNCGIRMRGVKNGT